MKKCLIAAAVLVAYAAVSVLLRLDPYDALIVLVAYYAALERLDRYDRKGRE